MAQRKTITAFFATETDMQNFSGRLAAMIPAGAVLFLSGPLGAGKTTFTRGFLRGLGYAGKVKSPTYTLVEPYDIAGRKLFHFDFYRLNDPKELEHIGIREYFSASNLCLIEWPDKGLAWLPEPDLACYIAVMGQGREIRIEAHSTLGEGILNRLL